MTSTNTPNISIGGNKTKSKLLNLSINDISSVGDNRGKGKMRNLSGLEFLKENSINKTGIIENANNESVNMRNKAKKKLSLPNNGDSEIKNSLHSSFQPATKSTPKTTKLKQMKEINLNSTKDLYLTTLSQNQSSPTKGRNKTTLINSVKRTTPNNRSSINSSINQSQSQMNSLSPFLTNTKSKSLIDRKSAIKATTHAYSTTLKGKNILNNLKKMNNITISNNNPFSTINIQANKNKTDKKTISSLMNTSTNIKIKKSTQDQYTSSNTSKSPMSKTTIATNTNSNSNFYPAEKNGKNMVDIKSRSTYYNSKLKEFKCLINELLHCEDKKIVQEFNEYIKEAYHNLEGKETIFEKQKLDEVNNIFECIKKENKEPKEFIQIKTEDFDSLYGKIKTLNKESQIANKNNKAGITKLITNSGINSASISKSTHVSSSPINARTMKKSPFASVKNFYKNHSNSNKVLNSSLFGKNLNFNVNFSKKTAPENKEELLKISLDNKTNNVSPSTVDEGNIKEEDNINYQGNKTKLIIYFNYRRFFFKSKLYL